MANNKVSSGETSKITLQSGQTAFASGKGIVYGTKFGVISKLTRPRTGDPEGKTVFTDEASAAGDIAIVQHYGRWRLPKASGAIGAGALVYWDAAAANVTTTSASNTLIGKAVWNMAQSNGGYLTGDTLIEVDLNA